MNMKEIIICSAVKIGDDIFRGNRHHDCFLSARYKLGDDVKCKGDTQGFITSTGRFVSREEARKIHEESGIEPARGEYTRADDLVSEDLY